MLSNLSAASSSNKLLDRKILLEKLLGRIFPLHGISGELTKYSGQQALRIVFASGIENRVAAVICIHNHSSSYPEPSQEHIRITERLVEAGKLVGNPPVLDHVMLEVMNLQDFLTKDCYEKN